MDDTLIGKEVKRLSDGKIITIKNERIVDDLSVFTDEDGNIYSESELDIKYRITPWYLMYEALKNNELVGRNHWEKHSDCFKCAFDDFMESMVKAGYITNNNGDKEG